MGPVVVVVVAPVLEDDAGFGEVGEVLDVEAFVSEAAVERLGPAVLPGRSGLDVGGVGARQAGRAARRKRGMQRKGVVLRTRAQVQLWP